MADIEDTTHDVKCHVFKQDDSSNIISSNAAVIDDEFSSYYELTGGATLIKPPQDLRALKFRVQNNNALGQCIAAMEVNIDGTGYTFEARDNEDNTENDDKISELQEFFDEPYPEKSFVTIRRALRVDLETTGNAYLEILRDATPDRNIVFIKHVPVEMIRLAKLDTEPHIVDKEITRKGKPLSIKLSTRPRKYAQLVGTDLIYFKEYGTKRDLNKVTGGWLKEGEVAPLDIRATELLHFTVALDYNTPYGIPRWLAQAPSVVGSRDAEELNLSFFKSGGIPPVIITLNGGKLTLDAAQALKTALYGPAAGKTRALVLETIPTAGNIMEGTGMKSSIDIERFGSEQQNDSMFENYDAKCEQRIRSSFRLPPLFVGRTDSQNFATAYASILLAETQVFSPEREEFDEIISVTLLRDMGYGGYKLRSKPVPVKDAAMQLTAIKLASDGGMASKEGLVEAINEVVDLNLMPLESGVDATTDITPPVQEPVEPVQKQSLVLVDPVELLELANNYLRAKGILNDTVIPKDTANATITKVENLSPASRAIFDAFISTKSLMGTEVDEAGAMVLSGCALELIGQ